MEDRVDRERTLRGRRATAMATIALRSHGLQSARVILLRDGFKQVFRVEHPSRGVFALRMYSEPPKNPEMPKADPRFRNGPGLRSPETLLAQLSWLSELRRETGLPMPAPVSLPDGSLVGHASFADPPRSIRLLRRVSSSHRDLYRLDHPGRHFTLLRWVTGKPSKKELSLDDASRIGAFAARLHNHAESYRPPEPSALPRWDWDWPFGGSAPVWDLGTRFYSASEMEVFREASCRVRRDLDRLGYGSGVFGLIHRDLTLQNLLFQYGKEDRTVGAIDFDMSGLAHYPFDLSVVLRAMGPMGSRYRHTGRLAQLKGSLLEGYERVRVLPDVQKESVATFDAMQQVATVNRTLELRASEATRPQARGEPFLHGAVARLQTEYLR